MRIPVLNDPMFIGDHESIVTVAEIHIAEKSAHHERKRRDRKFHAEKMPEARKNRERKRENVVFQKCVHYEGLWHGNPIRQEREINAEKIRMKDFSAEIYGGEFLTYTEAAVRKIRREEDVCWKLHQTIAEFEELVRKLSAEPDGYEFVYGHSNEYDRLLSAESEYYAEERW